MGEIIDETCSASDDGHCSHWYDCEPCCRCGDDTPDPWCDCDRCTAARSRSTLHHALARQFHEAYERIAAGEGWDTNPACRVAFDELPEANRATMLATVKAVLAMPEMQAIRAALLGLAASIAAGCNDDINHGDANGRFTLLTARSTLHENWLAEWMPERMDHVIDWVLNGAGSHG